MKKILNTLLALSAIVLFMACGGGAGNNIKIGVVLPDASEERWANQDGAFFEKELSALGDAYKYEILFSEGDEAKEKANVESLIARGVEVIIITSEGSGAGAVQAAKDAGVTLIAHDRMAKKNSSVIADYYTTFNSWNVGKAMGAHLLSTAQANGVTATNKADLALFSGRTADWPNATYFFGGAMEEIQPNLDIFNLLNVETAGIEALGFYTEATFDDAAKTALQNAMATIDTDWNAETAGVKAAAVVSSLNDADKSGEDVYVLAPNDDTSAAIRQEFAKMSNPYARYFTTGQDASDISVASLMGDPIKGKGIQTMTVFKDTSKLVASSVQIAKNIIDQKDGLDSLSSGAPIDGVDTAYAAIDTLTIDDPARTYDLIFKSGYKDLSSPAFSNIDFTQYQ